ncbi:uncharacterized protein LOC584274 [Strongylocentrotus purpuratus]|uniref:Uncharacterized protein n=1 Tax=Strongylocentrotus purpuratus TaxID=7668 RepID=A0A7M7RF90_STRPU|nr:uncharacterized protein LOC584274 [Strongylocentrotus purpuratus]
MGIHTGFIACTIGLSLAFLTLNGIHVDGGQTKDVGCDLKKDPEGCEQESCSSLVPSSCINGECRDGVCHCNPCWDGSKCDRYVNKHAPILQSIADIAIPRSHLTNPSWRTSVLGYAIATDDDRDVRCRGTIKCTCADLVYSVHEREGKESDLFKIDADGSLHVRQDQTREFSDKYLLTIRVSNPDDPRYSEQHFRVLVLDVDNDMDDDEDEIHHRFRRAEVADADLTEVNENNTIEFTLAPVSVEANGTKLEAGIKVIFSLTMDIPWGTYAEDVKVELYAEEGNFTFGILCPPSVTQAGSNIAYETATPSYDYDADNPFMATGAYLSLGRVTNNNASIVEGTSSITIEFSLTVLNDSRAGFSDSELRWITAGVEFANGVLLWVGQLGYYLQAATTNEYDPSTVTITPANPSINKLDFGVFTLSMNIYDMTSDVTVRVFGSPDKEGVASICGIGVRSYGNGFCLQNEDVVASYVADDVYKNNKEATFPFNSIINGGALNDAVDSEITMDVIVRLPSNDQAIVSTSYPVGISVLINDIETNASTTFTAAAEDSTITTGGTFVINSATAQVSDVIAGGSFPVRVRLTIPTGKYDLTLEAAITSPAGSSSPSMCRTTVYSSGYNLPCISSTCPDCSNDITAMNGAVTTSLNLGMIKNENLRADSSNNKATFDVWVGIPSSVAIGPVDVEFTLKSSTVVVGSPESASVNVISTIPADQDGKSLTFTSSLLCANSCTLANGAVGTLRVTVAVPTMSTFSNIRFAVTSQVIGDVERVGLCDAKISSAAIELGCLPYTTDSIEETKTSAAGSSLIDETLTFETGIVSNLDQNITGEFIVDILFRRMVVDLVDVDAARTIDLNVYVNDEASASHTFQASVVGTEDLSTWDATPPTDPVSIVSSVTSPNDGAVAPGTLATVNITLTMEAATSYAYSVDVDVNSNTLNIISLEGDVGGSDIPCGDPVFTDATLTSLNDEKTKQQATLDLGVVSASMTSSSSLSLSLLVQLSGDRALVADGSQHPINVVVKSQSDTTLDTEIINIGADYAAAAALTAVLPTSHTVVYDTVTSQEIEIGKESSFTQSITLSSGTTLGYRLVFVSNVTWFEFTEITLGTIGADLGGFTAPDLSPDPALPQTSLTADLGFIACLGSDCQIEFYVTVKARNDSGAMHGDVVQMDANVNVYTGDSTESQDVQNLIFYAINSTFIRNYTSTFDLTCPDSATTMTPGERAMCNITIDVIDQDVESEVEVVTTLNISYVGMVVRSLAVVEVGSNIVSDLGNLLSQTPIFTSHVNENSTQKDRVKLSLGRLHNNDIDNAAANDPDHQIVIGVEIQLTDSEEVVEGSQHILSAGVAFDAAYVWVSNMYIEASRSGTEQPDLSITYSMMGDTSNLVAGETVTYRIGLNHSDVSSAECNNVELRLLLPPYIDYQSIIEDGAHDVSYPIAIDASAGLTFQLTKVYFTDIIAFDVACTISSSYAFKGKTSWSASSPLQISYSTFDRSGVSITDGPTVIAFEEATYSLTASSPVSTSSLPTAVCASPVALGVRDRMVVKDCQIQASSEPNPEAAAANARLNGVGWKTEARAGDYLYDRFLKIDLGRRVALSRLDTQGGARAATATEVAFEGDIGKFEVLYSTDDVVYRRALATDGTFEFDHSSSSTPDYNRISEHHLQSPVEARYVIIRLTEYDFTNAGHLYNVLRTELYGCGLQAIQTDVCKETTVSPSLDDTRGVLIHSTDQDAFICDTKTRRKSGLQRDLDSQTLVINNKLPDTVCSIKRAAPSSQWSVLPDQVRQVIGYAAADDTLYAIGRDSSAVYYMKSTDDGLSWTPIPPSEWQAAVITTNVTKVPLESADDPIFSTILSADPDQLVRFDGIYSDDGTTQTKWVGWNQCCQKDCYLEGNTIC